MHKYLSIIVVLLCACSSREPTKAVLVVENRSGALLDNVQVRAYGDGVLVSSMADQASIVYELETGRDGQFILQFQLHGKNYVEKGGYITGGANLRNQMQIGPDGTVTQSFSADIPRYFKD